METLLIVAVILTALAIIVQAGILVSMYLMSRRITNKADLLMNDSHAITSDLKTAANHVAETSRMARRVVTKPIREYSAFASAMAEGLRTFFKERKTDKEVTIKEKRPAA